MFYVGVVCEVDFFNDGLWDEGLGDCGSILWCVDDVVDDVGREISFVKVVYYGLYDFGW